MKLPLGILFAQKDLRYAYFEQALEKAEVRWSILTPTRSQKKAILDGIVRSNKDRTFEKHLVVIDCEQVQSVEEIVRAVLNIVPWQEIILIGSEPLTDTSLKVTYVVDVCGAAEVIKKFKA